MASVLDICNLALAQIGHKVVISDLTEQSVEAEYCALFWPQVRDYVVASHNWSFAVNRVTLADVTATYPPPEEFEYTYSWPSECLKFIGVRDPNSTDDTINSPARLGASSGVRLIFTNVESAVGVYVKRVTDPTLFQPVVVEAMESLLASRLSVPLIKGQEGRQSMMLFRQQGEELLQRAKSSDASQDHMRAVTNPVSRKASWMEARGAQLDNSARIIRTT